MLDKDIPPIQKNESACHTSFDNITLNNLSLFDSEHTLEENLLITSPITAPLECPSIPSIKDFFANLNINHFQKAIQIFKEIPNIIDHIEDPALLKMINQFYVQLLDNKAYYKIKTLLNNQQLAKYLYGHPMTFSYRDKDGAIKEQIQKLTFNELLENFKKSLMSPCPLLHIMITTVPDNVLGKCIEGLNPKEFDKLIANLHNSNVESAKSIDHIANSIAEEKVILACLKKLHTKFPLSPQNFLLLHNLNHDMATAESIENTSVLNTSIAESTFNLFAPSNHKRKSQDQPVAEGKRLCTRC